MNAIKKYAVFVYVPSVLVLLGVTASWWVSFLFGCGFGLLLALHDEAILEEWKS